MESARPAPDEAWGAAVDAAFRAEQSRDVLLLSRIRLAGVSAALACSVWLGLVRGLPEWRENLGALCTYWSLAAALSLLVRLRPAACRTAAYALVFMDVPMVFWIQRLILPVSPSAEGVASFTLAVYCALTTLAALSLDRWLTVSTALAALVFDLVLMGAAGTQAGARVVGAVVLGMVAAGGWLLARRVRSLIGEVTRDELQRRTLERFFPRRLVDRLLSDRDQRELEPKLAECTILFFDIRGFSRLAEGGAEGLIEFQCKLRRIMTAMTEEILMEEGVVLQYLGDGILACWNAPAPDPGHVERACRAALGMTRRLREVDPALRCGIGLHTGRVVAGTIGSDQIFAYGIVGTAINQASRVENITKLLDVPVLATQAVAERLPPGGPVAALRLGTFRPAGMTAALTLYELSAAPADPSRAAAFGAAVEALERGDWAKVREGLRGLPGTDRAASYLAALAEAHLAQPPADWRGVIELSRK